MFQFLTPFSPPRRPNSSKMDVERGPKKELGILFFQVFTLSVPFIEDLQGLERYPNWNWKKIERNFRRNCVGFSSGPRTRFCPFHRRSSQLWISRGNFLFVSGSNCVGFGTVLKDFDTIAIGTGKKPNAISE